MSPHEKAVAAINTRLERLQANLRETRDAGEKQGLVQSIVALISVSDALNDYLAAVGAYARRRHAELSKANEVHVAEHEALMRTGQELLEKLKANPADRAIRKEIERAQRAMEAVQKNARRAANTLQNELSPNLAQLEAMPLQVRRLAEAEQAEVLKKVLKAVVGQVRELCAAHPILPRTLVDAAAWEKSAVAGVDEMPGFHAAYAWTGFNVVLALEFMMLSVAEKLPETAAEARQRADEAAHVRLKTVTARISAP